MVDVEDRIRQDNEDSSESAWDGFISYRRSDSRPVALWLRDRLKRFRLPDEIVRQLSPESKTLHEKRPRIFLDVAYEKSSPDFLERKVYPALDQSRRLIVISSPAAFEPVRDRNGETRDNWLWLEIDRFLGNQTPTESSRPIDVVLAPGAPEDRFPGRLAENAHWDWIDLRHFNRRRSFGFSEDLDEAWLKLAASFYDVPESLLPILRGEERRRRNRMLVAGTLTAVVIAVFMTGLAIFAANGRVEANRASARAQSYLETSQRRLADTLVTAAGTARSAGDELAAALLLAEARRTSVTPLVTAQTLACEKPRAAFRKTLVRKDEDGAWAFAFHPRTGKIAVGSYDGAVRLLSLAGGDDRQLLEASGPPVLDLAFSSDASRLFVLRRAPPDAAWNLGDDAESHSEIYRLDLDGDASLVQERRIASTREEPHFLTLTLTGDEDTLLVGSDRGVFLVPIDGGAATRLPEDTEEPEQGTSVAVSADGRWAAASTIRGYLRVWDLERRRQTVSYRVPTPRGTFEYNPFHLAFEPSGAVLAFGSFDGTLHLWNVAEAERPDRRLALHSGAVASVAWSPDGRWLASGGYDGTVVVVDSVSGEVVSRLSTTWPGLTSGALRLAFSADGLNLASSEAVPASRGARPGDWLFGTVRLWSFTEPSTFDDSVSGLSFDRDGSLAVWALGHRGQAVAEREALEFPCAQGRPWTALDEALARRFPVPFLEAAESESMVLLSGVRKPTGSDGERLIGPSAIHPDGRRVGLLAGRSAPSGDGIVKLRFLLCEIADPRPMLEVSVPVGTASTWAPVVFDRTGSRAILAVGEKTPLISGTRSTELFSVEFESGTLGSLGSWDSHATSSLALSGDARYAALSDENGVLALMDLETGGFVSIPEWLSGTPQLLAFSPRDRLLVAASAAQLRTFELKDGSVLNERRAQVSIRFQPTALDISPAGTVLVVGDAGGTISFWDLEKLEKLFEIDAHAGPVLSLDASPDGRAIATLGPDGLRLRGGFVPDSIPLAERLSRLRLVGSRTVPLGREAEGNHVGLWPDAAWELVSDPAAAAFWQLANEQSPRRIEPDSWWGWLFWSEPMELSPDLERWREEHPRHPLADFLDNRPSIARPSIAR